MVLLPESLLNLALMVHILHSMLNFLVLIYSLGFKRYGTRWFAATYSLIALCPALGSYIFSGTMAARLYEIETDSGECVVITSKLYRDPGG